MSKGLDALEIILEKYRNDETIIFNTYIIEKELKALEIIINKRVDMLCLLKSKSREQYNEESCSDMYLTVEEYNFLKEVLL